MLRLFRFQSSSRRSSPIRMQQAPRRPMTLESLEDRTVPAVADFTALSVSTGRNNFATYTGTGAKAVRNLNTGPTAPEAARTGPRWT